MLEREAESPHVYGKAEPVVCGGDNSGHVGHTAREAGLLWNGATIGLMLHRRGGPGSRRGAGMTSGPRSTSLPTVQDVSTWQRILQIRHARRCDPLRTCRLLLRKEKAVS